MAQWADEITLISLKEPTERLNENGFPNALEETSKTVFCNKINVGYAEYFSSQQVGHTVSAKVEVHKLDYDDETLAIFNNKRYSVQKTYVINDDVVELTLADLRQQSESEG